MHLLYRPDRDKCAKFSFQVVHRGRILHQPRSRLPLITAAAIIHICDGHDERLDNPEHELDGVPQGTKENAEKVVKHGNAPKIEIAFGWLRD